MEDARLLAAVEGGDRKLKELSTTAFLYAALRPTEDVGLWFRRRWAEYFTVIVTGSFIPLEVHELVRRVTVTRVSVLSINVAIVWNLRRFALGSACRLL